MALQLNGPSKIKIVIVGLTGFYLFPMYYRIIVNDISVTVPRPSANTDFGILKMYST